MFRSLLQKRPTTTGLMALFQNMLEDLRSLLIVANPCPT